MSDPYNTEKLYPVLEATPTSPPPTPLIVNGHEYRLRSCQKILENIEVDAKHYSSTLKKYTRSRNIFSHLCGVTTGASVVLSASGIGTGMTVVGIPVAVALGSLGGLCGMLGLGFGLASKNMSKKVGKHVDNVARAKATIGAINAVVSKAMRDGVISDVEYKIVTNIDNVYNKRIASNRRSVNSQDLKKMREQVEEEMKAGFRRVFNEKEKTSATPHNSHSTTSRRLMIGKLVISYHAETRRG